MAGTQSRLWAGVQRDDSHHDWLERRRAARVLMAMVNDATGRVGAQFFEQETTHASYDLFEGWVQQHGLPASLYVDWDSTYLCERKSTVAEPLAGEVPANAIGAGDGTPGLKLIPAHSSQAKGRAEQINGVPQDRLVKEPRLAGIHDLESANRFLSEYLAGSNRQFARPAASQVDAHRPAPRNWNEVLSWGETRVVQGDWTVARAGGYQLDRQHEALSLVRRAVIVRTLRDRRNRSCIGKGNCGGGHCRGGPSPRRGSDRRGKSKW